jgi:hypothetical protein
MSISNSMKAPTDPAVDAAMEEFLAKGGKIQQCAPNASGRSTTETYSAWGKPKKKTDTPLITPTEDPED